MSRNPELEAILQAKFDLDNCPDEQRTGRLHRYRNLLDEAVAKSALPGMTPRQVEELLLDSYREFRKVKLQEQRAKLSRLR